jgi:hypothetical protein
MKPFTVVTAQAVVTPEPPANPDKKIEKQA